MPLDLCRRGRPPGALNVATREVQEFCRGIIHSEKYRKKLDERIEAGTLPPQLECLIWHYGYGKPKESVDLNVTSDQQEEFASMSAEALLERSKAITEQIARSIELENAIDAEFKRLEAAPPPAFPRHIVIADEEQERLREEAILRRAAAVAESRSAEARSDDLKIVRLPEPPADSADETEENRQQIIRGCTPESAPYVYRSRHRHKDRACVDLPLRQLQRSCRRHSPKRELDAMATRRTAL